MATPRRRGAPRGQRVRFEFPYDTVVTEGDERQAYKGFSSRARRAGLDVDSTGEDGGYFAVTGKEDAVKAFVATEVGDPELAVELYHMIQAA